MYSSKLCTVFTKVVGLEETPFMLEALVSTLGPCKALEIPCLDL